MSITYESEQSFAKYLLNNIINRMSGEGDEGEYCKFNMPKDTYSVGTLSSGLNAINREKNNRKNSENEFYDEFLAKYAPYSIGIQFIADMNEDSIINISLGFNTYYRVFPKYEWQIESQDKRKLALIYKRKQIRDVVVEIKASELLKKKRIVYRIQEMPQLKNALDKVYKEIDQDESLFIQQQTISITPETLIKKESYEKFLVSLDKEKKIQPFWDIEHFSRK